MTMKSAEQAAPAEQGAVVNDFQIIVATENGTGSQTANTTLIRALFKMGIPVNGKNVFPSNIAGLPTWFYIRLSKDGYIARREMSEVLVAMNEVTIKDDIEELPSGGVLLYPDDITLPVDRGDIIKYPMPIGEIMGKHDVPQNLKPYVANMVYVGVLAQIIGIDMETIRGALDYHFDGREKPINLNMGVAEDAYEWAEAANLTPSPYRVEPAGDTSGKILMNGNSAGALGALVGGMTVAAWYPITPSTGLADALGEYAAKMRIDPDSGEATYAIVQAEDELAAIGVVLGAGWAGARAMTATSGPGISLMTEFAGMAYFAEIPSVVWDVQRVGPSTGLPTRTSQGDVMAAYFLGHGDTRHVVLLPGDLQECFEFGWRAFDLADELQTLVFVLSDLDLGMNLWMSDPFDYPTEPMKRGKVLSAEQLDKMKDWGRYIDVDGDGIGYRTLPGNKHPRSAYFTRGTGHDANAIYSEHHEVWVENMDRLERKFDTARTLVPAPVVDDVARAKIGIIAYGTSDAAVVEARDRLRDEGLDTDYLRLRSLPLSDVTRDFIAKHDRVYVIENNRDGQMHKIMQMEYPEYVGKMHSLAILNGLPLTARWITESIMEQEAAHG